MANYKKYTVIGGSGFVGTNLCKKFDKNGIAFEIIDIKESKQFPEKTKIVDIRDYLSLYESISGDLVINLAAVHRDDISNKDEYYSTNVDGAQNIVKVCEEKEISKIIFTSSVAVYGFTTKSESESGKTIPFNHYGKSKLMAEEIFVNWQKKLKEHSLIIIRPTVIFGEGNRGNVYNLFNQIYRKRFFMIGSGKNKKSMAYIENVSSFIASCISNKTNFGLYNYVDEPDINMNELVLIARKVLFGKESIGLRLPYFLGILFGLFADLISKIFSINLSISSIRIKKFCKSTTFKSDDVYRLSFKPPYSLKDGIERTLHSEFINPDPCREIFYTE